MKKLPGFLIIFIGIFAGSSQLSLYSQEQEGMVKYTTDFRFTDGIYLDFNMVKMNNPIPKTKIVTSVDYNSDDFFEKLTADEKIYYYDDEGVKNEVNRDIIWGYANNGIIYMQMMGNFSPFTFMGRICHIVAEIKYNDSSYYNPSDYRSYYYPYSIYPDYLPVSDAYARGYYRPYDRYSPSWKKSMRKDYIPYLIDFETGNTWTYDIQSVKMLIKKDNELYDEFIKLRHRMKKRIMFSFIRRFNERNPLYIPEGKFQ
jgi:hypothetical protein